ncbi:glycosyltransferase [Candidatus Protochlamydia sp. W-9]|uniref:glycosyltransferase n=1 Tax=Candidatus Protochlamydia sp. W-9 TaxID=1785087 RepID=UPI00096A2F07|nr:glycosyltransferase [Candidatus Protochlamydia sp. W-9]
MDNETPLISVVIPVYNHEKFVSIALDSVLHQSYPLIEIIIIDDGSKDHSAEIVEQWLKQNQTSKQGYSFTFIRQQNSGAHATINRGLTIAKGSLLTILNSDDIYERDRLKKLVDRLQTEKGRLIFSGIKGIDDQGVDLPFSHPWKKSYEDSLCSLVEMPTVGFQLMKSNLAISTGNLLFTKDLYEAVGGFRNLELAHDYDFLLRALLHEEPIFFDEPLYLYRLHSNNTFSQINHLLQSDLNEIYRTYLLEISKSPPLNVQAPCPTYWPLAFPLIRDRMNMDQALNYYLTKPQPQLSTKLADDNKKAYPSLSTTKKIKISLITHELSLTGAPKVVVDLAIRLKQDGHYVNVISLKNGPMRQQLENQGISISVIPKFTYDLTFHKNSFISKAARVINTFWMMLKLQRTMIGNSVAVAFYLTLLSLNPFYRIFWYIHESLPPAALLNVNQKRNALLDKMKANSNVKIWFGSDNTRELWKKAGFSGTTKYWSGINASKKRSTSRSGPISEILSVGTSSARKGTYYLIEAFIKGILEKSIPDHVNLTIIGFFETVNRPDCHFLGDLILKIVNYGLLDRIHLMASLQPDQIDYYYHRADLYIQASISECLPLAIFQAMAVGLPIISTNVNGCPEAIEDGKTGYICYPRSLQALLHTILKALADPEKTRQMGEQAQKKFIEKFNIEKNFKEINQVFFN